MVVCNSEVDFDRHLADEGSSYILEVKLNQEIASSFEHRVFSIRGIPTVAARPAMSRFCIREFYWFTLLLILRTESSLLQC
jgi:hypothetical protein